MNNRYESIDEIRAISLILILIFHIFYRFPELYGYEKIGYFSKFGEIGSTTFLMISCLFLSKKTDKVFNIKQYIKKKFVRLWPIYIFCITITFIVVKILGLPGREVEIKDYLLNLFFLNGFIKTPYVDGAHWYMTILISFIMIIGFLRWIKKFSWQALLCWMFLAFAFKVLHLNIPFDAIGGGYIGFVLYGYTIWEICSADGKNHKSIILSVIAFSYTIIMMKGLIAVISIISFICLIVCIKFSNRIYSSRILLFIASISYPTYLIHQNISYALLYKAVSISGNFKFYYGIVAFFSSLFIGFILHKYVENRIIKVLRYISIIS